MTIVIMDACCLINLYAADNLTSLLTSLGWEIHVSAHVLAETYYILRKDEEQETQLVRQRIDLQPAIDAGLLHPCDVGDGEELELFVQLATTLDDGEAACLAIAKSRSWVLATDDRKAIRLAGTLGVGTVTTPELIKRWADVTRATDAEVGAVPWKIQNFANFIPRRGSAFHQWWSKLSDLFGE
jgi:predicted nucleic acid-binding protein